MTGLWISSCTSKWARENSGMTLQENLSMMKTESASMSSSQQWMKTFAKIWTYMSTQRHRRCGKPSHHTVWAIQALCQSKQSFRLSTTGDTTRHSLWRLWKMTLPDLCNTKESFLLHLRIRRNRSRLMTGWTCGSSSWLRDNYLIHARDTKLFNTRSQLISRWKSLISPLNSSICWQSRTLEMQRRQLWRQRWPVHISKTQQRVSSVIQN